MLAEVWLLFKSGIYILESGVIIIWYINIIGNIIFIPSKQVFVHVAVIK